MIELYAIQISQWRLARDRGITLIDITAKSGIQAFAPDFSKVMDYKNGVLDKEVYTAFYIDKMRLSYTTHQSEWIKLSEHSTIALACYCKVGTFCHRHLFKDMFKKHLDKKGIEFHDYGELY